MFGKGKASKASDNASGSVYRIKPFEYIHVADNNSGATEVIVGPRTFTRQVRCPLTHATLFPALTDFPGAPEGCRWTQRYGDCAS